MRAWVNCYNMYIYIYIYIYINECFLVGKYMTKFFSAFKKRSSYVQNEMYKV